MEDEGHREDAELLMVFSVAPSGTVFLSPEEAERIHRAEDIDNEMRFNEVSGTPESSDFTGTVNPHVQASIQIILDEIDSDAPSIAREVLDEIILLAFAVHEYDLKVIPIDHVNDLVDLMLKTLPQRCWLQLDADYPGGSFYHECLSVNKLLNITSSNLLNLLGPRYGHYLDWKHVVFNATNIGLLSRHDGSRAIWIFIDLTGAGPSEGPGELPEIFYFFVNHIFNSHYLFINRSTIDRACITPW